MSHLLELLGRGLGSSIGELLARHFWSPPRQTLERMEDACRANPQDADAHFQLGLALLRETRAEEAVECLTRSCRFKPDFAPARLALASALSDCGRVEQAMEQLKISNQVHPGEAEILFAIGFCCERLRRSEQAAEYYRDAVAKDGTLKAARERLAAVDVLMGNNDEAIAQYQAMLQAGPEETWMHTALAHLYFRDGKFHEAVEKFETAIALEPTNWSLVDDEVEALVADGQIPGAIDRLRMLLEQQGPFADLHVRLADLYSQSGDDDEALRHYNAAREIQPNYLEAAVKLGTHHMIFGRWDQAAEAFCEASELNDRQLVNYVGMGVCRSRSGDRPQALRDFDLASALEPNSSMLLAEMARLQLKSAVADEYARSFEASGDVPVAEIDLDNDHLLSRQLSLHQQEIERHPRHADLRYRYGVLLRAEGRLGEAMEQFRQAVEINPAYVQAIIKLGVTQQELGMVDEAIATFHGALDIQPKYVDLHYRLGLLYTDRREFEEAVKEVEAAAGGAEDNASIRAGLAISLQNMGLMDRSAATWRSLSKMHQGHVSKKK